MAIHSSRASSRTLSATIAAVLATAAPGARAQDDDVIANVTVTATRRAESIQEVPLNIAAIGGDRIAQQGLSDLVEVSRTVPGLFVLDQGGRAANAIIVRGLNAAPVTGTEALGNTGGGTVATYVGEIPLFVDLKLEDMERVEVLLGPQGTLYGAGTLGGAIRYIPRRPQFDATTVTLRGDTYALSQSDGLGAKGGMTFNVPFGERLAFRASFDYLDDPGFIDYNYLVRVPGVSDPQPDLSNPAAVAANLSRKEDVDSEKTWSGRAALRWQVSETVDADLTYYYQDQDVGGRTLNQRDSFGTGRYESAQRYLEPNERKNQLTALEITADLGFAELTSATGYSKYDEIGQRDQTDLLITLQYSYEAFPTFSAFTRDGQEDETVNQEIRLVSTGDGPWKWLAGAFYNKYDSVNFSKEFTPGYSQYMLDNGEDGVLRPDALEYYAVDKTELVEKAAYGELAYAITDRWQVTVGARWYEYDLDTRTATDLPLDATTLHPDGRGPNDIILVYEPGGQSDDGSLFKFNTSYKFTPGALAYFTVSEGYRVGNSNGIALCSGGSGGQNVCAQPNEFQYFPDSTVNYEIGVRTQWLDRRLTLNGAVFYVDWTDPQLTSSTKVGAAPITINGKGARSQGIELSFDASVTDRFSVRGSYGYADAELTETATDLIRTIEPPAPGSTNFAPIFVSGLKGDRLPGSPKHQGNIFASYAMPLNNAWELTLNYGISAIGDIFTRAGNRGSGEALPGFALHSMSAAVDAGSWTLTAYAENLLNKYAETGARTTPLYIQTAADANGDPVAVRAYSKDVVRPREIGLRFTYNFEL
jgi:outer membrane receptor protein involved in Fe transport